MTDLIERMEEALVGVTDGPWQDYEFSGGYYVAFMNDDSGPAMQVGSWHKEREANARFIAAARTLLPEAMKEIKRLEAKLADG